MDAASLLASAGINVGFALVLLSLFSVLKKQRCTAPVYLARRIALAQPAGGGAEAELPAAGFSLDRLRPSVSWIIAAVRVSEEETLSRCGLDALVVLRLFKFGVKFFTVCSVIGVLILVPVNCATQQGSYSMDSFTISNVEKGSNRLWVHFSCLCLISFYALYLLYKEYKGILGKRILQIHDHRKRPDQFTVLVRGIPLCIEHKAHGCSVDHFFSKHHPYTYESYKIVYDGKNIEKLLHLSSSLEGKIKNLRQKEVKKHGRGCGCCGIFCLDVAEIEKLKERLHEVCQKIRFLQCENVLKQKELPAAFVSFRSRWGAALAAQTQQHVHPLLWVTESAPEPRDVIWNNLAIPYRLLALHKIVVFIAASLLIVFFAIPVTAVQGIVQLEKIKEWFPPARAVQLIPGLSSILTGYLPSVILNGFIYLIPYAMLGMASLEGYVSRSKKEIKACSMVFYFLVGNVFFLSVLSGSLLHQIGESFTHPKDFPSHLASAVAAQSDFFITYILTDGLSGFSFEILQLGLLIWHFIRMCSFGQGAVKDPYLFGFPYYRVIPMVSLAILIGMVYAVIAPLLLPLLIVYFLLGYAVYVNQVESNELIRGKIGEVAAILRAMKRIHHGKTMDVVVKNGKWMKDVYDITYETYGQYWPYIHHYIFITIVLMQITMIGVFGLKSKPVASISTILLLLLTILFNEHCNIRFRPTFFQCSVQTAKQNDELDEMEGQVEANQRKSIDGYDPPWMRPVRFTQDSSSTQPLIES